MSESFLNSISLPIALTANSSSSNLYASERASRAAAHPFLDSYESQEPSSQAALATRLSASVRQTAARTNESSSEQEPRAISLPPKSSNSARGSPSPLPPNSAVATQQTTLIGLNERIAASKRRKDSITQSTSPPAKDASSTLLQQLQQLQIQQQQLLQQQQPSSQSPSSQTLQSGQPNVRKSQVLVSLLAGAIGYLESCPGVSEVKLCTRPPVSLTSLQSWDTHNQSFALPQRHVHPMPSASASPMHSMQQTPSHSHHQPKHQCNCHFQLHSLHFELHHPTNVSRILPPDLMAFYSITDGLSVQWTVRFPASSEPDGSLMLGMMQINALDKLTRVEITPHQAPMVNTSQSSSAQSPVRSSEGIDPSRVSHIRKAGQIPKPPTHYSPPTPAFVLHDSQPHGRVLILPTNPTAHIWFQQHQQVRSPNSPSGLTTISTYHPLATTFTAYFRLMVAHLGISGWQSFMVSSAMASGPTGHGIWDERRDGAAADWLGFYAVERATLARRVKAGGVFDAWYDEGCDDKWDLEKITGHIKAHAAAKSKAAAAAEADCKPSAGSPGRTIPGATGITGLAKAESPPRRAATAGVTRQGNKE